MSSGLSCTVFLPGESQGIAGFAHVSSVSMRVEWDGGRVEFQYHALSAGKGGYNDKMLIFSASDQVGTYSFYFDNKAVVDAMSGYRLPPGLATQIARSAPGMRAYRGVALWLLLGVAIVVGLYFAVVALSDNVVDFAVEQIPVEMEVELGKAAAGQQLGDMQVCSAAPVNQAIDEMGKRLVEGLGETPYTYRFVVVDIPDVNAFALPGGYIFINWGLVEKAETADQVAGVVAHEIQHAVARHGLRNVIARAGIWMLVGALFGDLQGVGGLIAGGAGELAALSFSREQEDEADRLGLDLLYAAHFDPSGMPQFFEKLKEEQAKLGLDFPSFMSSHPDTDARISNLQAKIVARGKSEVTPLSLTWETVKEAGCLPVHHSDPDKGVEMAAPE
jgi:beta-barrel assembly-enhancing protease